MTTTHPKQTPTTHIDTGGGPYVGGNVNTGGKFVGRDDFSQTFIVNTTERIPLAARPPTPPQIFLGRQAELRQLQEWLVTVTPDFLRNEGHPAGKMGLIYGPAGVGKSTLIRQWLAGLRASQQPPIIAHISFDSRVLVGKQSEPTAWTQAVYELNWQTLATAAIEAPTVAQPIARYFPSAFRLGSCPWIALAAQLTIQSQQVQQALARGEAWTVDLRFDNPRPPAEALTELLSYAVREERPIVLACEGVQHGSQAWFDLLQSWETEIRSKEWPVLLLLEYDYPHPLTASPQEAQPDARLTWLRQRCAAPSFPVEALYLGPLTRHAIEEMLLPGSQQYANDLFLLSDGMPDVLRELLDWWREREIAEETLPGYWTVKRLPTHTYLFTKNDLLTTIKDSLERSAELAAGHGYNLSATDLLDWLNYAVWEGDAFHGQALALAVGWRGDALNDFLAIVDGALCQREEHPQGLLEKVTIKLPDGDNQPHHLTRRYRFVLRLVAVLLRQRQRPQDRLRYGQAYAQALETVYAPHHEPILDTLAALYQSLGLAQIAARYRQRWNMLLYLAQEEAILTGLLAFAKEEEEQKSLLRRMLRFFNDAYNRRPPDQLLPWLQEALILSRHLRDQVYEARTLYSIGLVYYALSDHQQALAYYQQALPLRRQVGDTAGAARTLHHIGLVYYALSDHQQALAYYQQALPLYRQVGDTAETAKTLYSIGRVHADLQEYQQALTHYQQALPLYRQVGDTAEEARTLHSIGLVYYALSDHQQALAYYQQALPLRRQVGDTAGAARTLHHIGLVYYALSDHQQALTHYQQALPLQRQVGNHWDECMTLWWLAHIYETIGNLVQAEEHFVVAVEVAEAVQHSHLQTLRTSLERVRNKRADTG